MTRSWRKWLGWTMLVAPTIVFTFCVDGWKGLVMITIVMLGIVALFLYLYWVIICLLSSEDD